PCRSSNGQCEDRRSGRVRRHSHQQQFRRQSRAVADQSSERIRVHGRGDGEREHESASRARARSHGQLRAVQRPPHEPGRRHPLTSSQRIVPSVTAVSPTQGRGRDRWVILTGLAGITAAAWLYLHVGSWTTAGFGARWLMWAVMMVAMMVPSAAPMTLVYAAVARKVAREDHPVAPTFVFVAG